MYSWTVLSTGTTESYCPHMTRIVREYSLFARFLKLDYSKKQNRTIWSILSFEWFCNEFSSGIFIRISWWSFIRILTQILDQGKYSSIQNIWPKCNTVPAILSKILSFFTKSSFNLIWFNLFFPLNNFWWKAEAATGGVLWKICS